MVLNGTSAAIAIIARVPSVEGKSRLSPCLDQDLRVDLQRAFLLDTLEVVRAVDGAVPYVAFYPPYGGPEMFHMIGGRAGLIAQQGRDLGERLRSVAACLFHLYSKVVLIGSDSPAIQPDHLQSALRSLDRNGACLGPTEDGGYYLIGLRRRLAPAFQGIDWGTNLVLSQTVDRLAAAGISYELLETLYDVDTPEDLLRLRTDLDSATPARRDFIVPARTLELLRKAER